MQSLDRTIRRNVAHTKPYYHAARKEEDLVERPLATPPPTVNNLQQKQLPEMPPVPPEPQPATATSTAAALPENTAECQPQTPPVSQPTTVSTRPVQHATVPSHFRDYVVSFC